VPAVDWLSLYHFDEKDMMPSASIASCRPVIRNGEENVVCPIALLRGCLSAPVFQDRGDNVAQPRRA
jgi:hypothetical protein